MKRASMILALLLMTSMSSVAYAEGEDVSVPPTMTVIQSDAEAQTNADTPILKDVQMVSEDGQQRIIKTWETVPGYAPEQLVEPDFQKNGYTYKKNYLLMVSENQQKQSKLASQTVTVSHGQKDGAIALLAPLLDYDQDGYKGQLKLDTASIYTEAAGKQNYTYAITDTREYTGLERNDTYNIPKTVTKSGATLQLADVDWTEMGEGRYRALATYSGSATGVNVSGYNQMDERWCNEMYGKSQTIGYGGCGPTAMAIVVSSLTDTPMNPKEMADWAVENGYCCEGNGSYHSLIPGTATAYGLSVQGAGRGDKQKILDALADGKLVVAIMGPGHFTTSGHFIVLRGVTAEGKLLVADPVSYTKSQKEWDASIVWNEARRGAAAGGPFWIIG